MRVPGEEVRTEQRLCSMNAMSSIFNLSYCSLCDPLCLKRSLGFVAETEAEDLPSKVSVNKETAGF